MGACNSGHSLLPTLHTASVIGATSTESRQSGQRYTLEALKHCWSKKLQKHTLKVIQEAKATVSYHRRRLSTLFRRRIDSIMERSRVLLEQGPLPTERSRLLPNHDLAQDEKYIDYQCFGVYAEKQTLLTRDDKRRRICLWIFIAITVLLVVATWLLHSTRAIERLCHPNGFCTIDKMTPGSVADAPFRPDDAMKDPNVMKDTPQYVLDYAPYVYLHKDEEFWPGTMEEHLLHTTPALNYTPVEKDKLPAALNLMNLDQLNAFERGRNVFLTSNDNVEDRPEWLSGAKNIPENYTPPVSKGRWLNKGMTSKDEGKGSGGRSNAPAILITIDKGNGIVDAFWFFFYSYNLGNIVLNIRWGNHVGDWEHTMVRFHHGHPKVVFFSEHNFGAAYSYAAVEKIGRRPVAYSAIGSHAMYATPGLQPYILPLGMLHDTTSRGPLWDPTLNLRSYTYHPPTDTLTPSTLNPSSPTGWFFFNGKWGDKSYPLSDGRQYGLVGEYHYVNGPLGPRFKNLARRRVCQGRYEDPCVIRHWLEASLEEKVVNVGESRGEGEGMPVGLVEEAGE